MAALVNAYHPCCSSNQNRGGWHVFGCSFFFFESHNWHFCFHQVQRTPKAKLFVNIIITASCISSNLFVQMHRERVRGVCTIYIQTPRPGHDLVVSRETEKHIK